MESRILTPSIFSPASVPAEIIVEYTTLVLAICAAIFVVVSSLIVYCVARFRERADDNGREPPQIYGGGRIELAWTVAPVLIVAVLFVVTARTILTLQKDEPPPGSLQITATGHQWWWEFDYADLGFVTANELHLPLMDDTSAGPAFLNLESQDVIHSFWVPQLSGKMDLIPNRTNHLWIAPTESGVYVGQCAEYCGTQHANMLLRVVVEPRADFERWVREQQRPATNDSAVSVAVGRAVFEETACVSCHSVRGTPANGTFGPDLTHLMSRTTLGAGVATNDRAHLIEWITSPDHLKPGARMPAMQLEPAQILAVVDYLESLQ
ncbi:MAG: cytochrome c oxidase subunit II [Myxococcales bacterium]